MKLHESNYAAQRYKGERRRYFVQAKKGRDVGVAANRAPERGGTIHYQAAHLHYSVVSRDC